MAVADDKLKQYYTYLKSANADAPDTYESFQNTLSNEENAKQYYDYLKTNNFDAPETYDSFANTLGLKKKDYTPEQLESAQASLQGVSVRPEDYESEAPSIPKELQIVNKELENITSLRGESQEDRTMFAQRKISLEREKKSLERQLSSIRGSLTSPTGRTAIKSEETKQKLQDRLKEISQQFKEAEQDLNATIDKESDLEQANDLLIKTKKLYEQQDENSLNSFKEGLLSPLAKDFFSIGIAEMARQYNILDIATKYREQGAESLTEEENAALGAYGIFQMASQDPQSVTYNVGRGVAEMIPYMAQFALTGGVGNLAKGATQSLLKAGTKKGVQKALIQGTSYAVGALARTPLMTMTQEEFARRRTGDVTPTITDEGLEGKPEVGTEETVGEAAYKAFATTFAEVFTEELGGAVTKPLGKLAGKIGINKLTKGLDNAIINRVKDAVKFNGIVGEYSEELINSYLQAGLTGDQPISEVWNGKEQLETLLTVGTVGAIFMGTSAVTKTKEKNKTTLVDERTKSFDKIDDQFKDEVQKISEIEDVDEKSTVLEQYIYEKDLDGDQLKNVVEYVTFDNTIKSMDIVEEEITPTEQLEAQESTKTTSEGVTTTEEKEELKTTEIKTEEVTDVQEKEEVKEEGLQDQKEVSDAKEGAQVRQEAPEAGKEQEEQLGDMPERTKEEEKEKVAYETFREDFLSDEVNLNQIDVPLKMKDRIAAAKNLREGKDTKQAQILEDYIKQSYESGQLGVVQQAAGGKSVKTNVPIESIIKAEEKTPIVEEPIPKARKVAPQEPIKAKERIRGVEQNIFQATESEQQKFVQTIVDANKETYEVLSYEAATEDAKRFIAEKGSLDQAYDDLRGESSLKDLPTRQVARLSLMDYYSRKAINENVPQVEQEKAVERVINMEKALAREATAAGQGGAVLNIWKAKQPASVLKVEQKKIRDYNKKILERKISGKTTVKQQINKVAETIDEESKKIAKDIISKNKKYKEYRSKAAKKARRAPVTEAVKKKKVSKEKIKKEQDYRKERIEKWKKERGQSLQAGLGFTTEDIEFAGDMIASYVREGFYRLEDVTVKLRKDFKDVGVELTDENIDQILSQERDGKTIRATLKEEEAKEVIPSRKEVKVTKEVENVSQKLDDIITKHWTERDKLGRTLADKFVAEAGLTKSEANELSNIVLEEYNKEIEKRSQQELTKLLGRSPLPKKKTKRKNVVDRLIDAVNLGALDSEFYTQLFGEYFGLQEITPNQAQKILELADNLQKLSGKGVFETQAALDLVTYMYELYPKSKGVEALNVWIDMTYASLLSGVSTSILNMTSAGSNIMLKPVRDVVNISKWIDTVKKHKTEDAKAVYNPFGEMIYMPALSGIKFGAKEAARIYREGGFSNKYIDEVSTDKAFKVNELERPKYGKGKRFKPINIPIAGKKVDVNLFNAYKYSGRNLLAQDRLMYNTIHDIEVASVLADKFYKTGLKGKALRKAVIGEVTGRNLDKDIINQKLDSDIQIYEEATGKKATKLDREVRKREIMLDMLDLTPEEREEIDRLARANIFTDDRGGLIAHAAYGIGRLANSNVFWRVTLKPFVPFTKIVGNVTEYMLDHTPFYGFFRANGLSVTGAYKKLTGVDMLTSQMGEKGSKEYYEQMGRAWLGTVAFSMAAMLLLGNDEDDFIELSGGRNQEGWQRGGRENVMPNYTLRIGDVMLPYLNIPALAIPFGLIGNLNDALQSDMSEGEATERLTASMLFVTGLNTVTMTKDMSIVQGIGAFTQMVTDLLSIEENKVEGITKDVAKRYLSFASRPLPQNVNMVRQVAKFFDPTSYSRKDIQEILAYSAGLEHFVNNPSIDQLGDEVKTYPGETLMPYTHWFNLKGGDERWEFLAKYNSIPKKIFNTQRNIEVADEGFERRKLTSDEFYEYAKLAGNKFSDKLRVYMAKDDISDRAKEIIVDEVTGDKMTRVQQDVDDIRKASQKEAVTELFMWGVAKQEKSKKYEIAKKYGAIKPYQSSKQVTINEKKYNLSDAELYRMNTYATLLYLDNLMLKYGSIGLENLQKLEYTDEYGRNKTGVDFATDELWRESRKSIMDKDSKDNKINEVLDIERLIEKTK